MVTLQELIKKENKEKETERLVKKGVLLERKDGGYATNLKNLRKEQIKQTIKDIPGKLLSPVNVSSSNVSAMQRTPMTILSKEQAMLQALFGQKHQLWGNGQPVQINNTLTSGNGLIKTGSGNATRRLMF